MTGLGRVPQHFKDWHKCGKCEGFLPLWDLAFGRWCTDCVKGAGGLLKAGEIVEAQWREAHPRPIPRPQPKATIVVRSAESWNGGADIPGAAADGARIAEQARSQPARDAKQWQRAQSLHKAMKCTVEEAYDRLNAADAARKASNENLAVS